MGKVSFPESEREELTSLRAELKSERKKKFDEKGKQVRLDQLERKEHNYERSQGNLKAVTAVGLAPSVEVVQQITSKLLDAGAEVDVKAGGKQTTKIEAPSGPLIMDSRWREIEGGQSYLVTVIFKSPKGG